MLLLHTAHFFGVALIPLNIYRRRRRYFAIRYWSHTIHLDHCSLICRYLFLTLIFNLSSSHLWHFNALILVSSVSSKRKLLPTEALVLRSYSRRILLTARIVTDCIFCTWNRNLYSADGVLLEALGSRSLKLTRPVLRDVPEDFFWSNVAGWRCRSREHATTTHLSASCYANIFAFYPTLTWMDDSVSVQVTVAIYFFQRWGDLVFRRRTTHHRIWGHLSWLVEVCIGCLGAFVLSICGRRRLFGPIFSWQMRRH